MNAKQNMNSDSSIEQQLNSVRLSRRDRAAALHDARIAEAFVELFTWAGSKANRPDASVFAKPSPKY